MMFLNDLANSGKYLLCSWTTSRHVLLRWCVGDFAQEDICLAVSANPTTWDNKKLDAPELSDSNLFVSERQGRSESPVMSETDDTGLLHNYVSIFSHYQCIMISSSGPLLCDSDIFAVITRINELIPRTRASVTHQISSNNLSMMLPLLGWIYWSSNWWAVGWYDLLSLQHKFQRLAP
jgi:hypothetical protein